MGDRETIANALRLSNGCLKDAELLASAGSRNAAYMAEQALEQAIRAIATSEGVHIMRSDAHQLDKIIRNLPDENPTKSDLAKLAWLEAYATTFRYTSPAGRIPRSPDAAKPKDALAGIKSLIDRLSGHFGVDIGNESEAAETSFPQRSR